jgi:hypothetical protein
VSLALLFLRLCKARIHVKARIAPCRQTAWHASSRNEVSVCAWPRLQTTSNKLKRDNVLLLHARITATLCFVRKITLGIPSSPGDSHNQYSASNHRARGWLRAKLLVRTRRVSVMCTFSSTKSLSTLPVPGYKGSKQTNLPASTLRVLATKYPEVKTQQPPRMRPEHRTHVLRAPAASSPTQGLQ